MANEILLTPELMRDKAGQIRSIKAEQEEIMSNLTNLVSGLSAVWRGDAQDAFVAKYMGMRTTFTNFANAIGEFATLMTDVATKMENTDNSVANRIRGV